MIRLIGAVLVAAGAAWLGFQAAEELRRRSRAVSQMARGLALLERELELSAPPLPKLLERAAQRSAGPARILFEGCREGMERLDQEEFASLWSRLTAQRGELGAEGQALLVPLGDVLGRYGGQAQIQALAAVRRQLEELAARGEEERRRRGRVYQALGLSGGAFFVILLL